MMTRRRSAIGIKQSATPHSIMIMDAMGFDVYDKLQRARR